MASAPTISISGELTACTATDFRLARKSFLAAAAKAAALPVLHAKGFYDSVAGNALMQNVLDVGQLVLAFARGACARAARFCRRKQSQTEQRSAAPMPACVPAQSPRQSRKTRVNNCCRNSASAMVSVTWTFSTSFTTVETSVPVECRGEKRNRALQNRVIQAIAQVRDQSKAGVIDQIRANVIANALDQRRPYQGNRNHGKRVGENAEEQNPADKPRVACREDWATA